MKYSVPEIKKEICLSYNHLCNTFVPSTNDFAPSNDKFKWLATVAWWIKNGSIIQRTSIVYDNSLARFWITASCLQQIKEYKKNILQLVYAKKTSSIFIITNNNTWRIKNCQFFFFFTITTIYNGKFTSHWIVYRDLIRNVRRMNGKKEENKLMEKSIRT